MSYADDPIMQRLLAERAANAEKWKGITSLPVPESEPTERPTADSILEPLRGNQWLGLPQRPSAVGQGIRAVSQEEQEYRRAALAHYDPNITPVEAPEEPYTGELTPRLYLEKGTRFRIWKNGRGTSATYNVQIDCPIGARKYWATLKGSIAAEGMLARNNTGQEGKAFRRRLYEDVLKDLRTLPTNLMDNNYTHCCSPIFEDKFCEGTALPVCFMVALWKGDVPTLVIYDADKQQVVEMKYSNGADGSILHGTL